MGWDVVQIGLKHDLPVEDPIATAELVAKRMNRNIRLVYEKEIEYDKINNIVSDIEDFDDIEIAVFTIDSKKNYLKMKSYTYLVNQILKETDIETLQKAKFTSEWAKSLLLENPDTLYEIEYEDVDEYLDIRIYQENVDLDVSIGYRWWMWEHLFHPQDFNCEILLEHRMAFFKQAQMFGCKEVIICSDQGPTMEIYEHIDLSAEQLKQYVYSNKHHEESGWYEPEEMESWKKHAKKISFSSVFQKDFKLEGEDFVELVYDDFKDLI